MECSPNIHITQKRKTECFESEHSFVVILYDYEAHKPSNYRAF